MRRFALVVPLLVLSGCGSSSGSAPLSTATPAVAHVPQCAKANGRAGIAPFPLGFPLPRGTQITTNTQRGGGTVLTGAIPTDSFTATAKFFLNEVPKRGFKITSSDSEPPHDAEGEFRGHGYVGRWRIQSILGCGGAVSFQAFAQKAT